jgi:hypothetical protein
MGGPLQPPRAARRPLCPTSVAHLDPYELDVARPSCLVQRPDELALVATHHQ